MLKHVQLLLLLVAMIVAPGVIQAQSAQDYVLATGTDSTMWITLSSSATHVSAIEGEDGRTIFYCHLASRAVETGQVVKAGQYIGERIQEMTNIVEMPGESRREKWEEDKAV